MVEQDVKAFDARCLTPDDPGVSKPCVLFFTGKGIVVGIIEGISAKLFVVFVIYAAFTFLGLSLRDLRLFLAGFVATIAAGSLIVLTDFIVRRQSKRTIKKTVPAEVLRLSTKNFEISYSDLVKVKHVTFERLEGGDRFFLPTFSHELMHEIEVATLKGRYAFTLDRSDLNRCVQVLNKYVPEKIEKENEN